MKRLMIVAAAAALTAACMGGPTGEAATIAEAARAQTAPPAMEFLRMAGASDQYEIQSSQAVLQTTQNADLRRFAEMMIEHHTLTTATLTRAAQAAGIAPPPPALDARKSQMIAQLQAAQGAARDALYIEQQVMAHREALTLHTSYAENGDTEQLRGAATAAVPIVARHYNEIVGMQSGMAGVDHASH
jgi:putative membrane protein